MGLSYLTSLPGILKVVILVLGFIASVCVIYGCDNTQHVRNKQESGETCSGGSCRKKLLDGETVQAGAGLIGAVWVATIILVVVCCLTELSKMIDAVLLVVAGILFLIGGALCLVFAIQAYEHYDCSNGAITITGHWMPPEACKEVREESYHPLAFVIGGVVAVINGVVCIVAGVLAFLK